MGSDRTVVAWASSRVRVSIEFSDASLEVQCTLRYASLTPSGCQPKVQNEVFSSPANNFFGSSPFAPMTQISWTGPEAEKMAGILNAIREPSRETDSARP